MTATSAAESTGRAMNVVWFARKYLDTSLDSGTWTSMLRALYEADCRAVLATGYRRSPSDFGLGDRLAYLPAIRLPLLNAASMLAVGFFAMPRMARE